MAQTVFPFKFEETGELLTANAGLSLFGDWQGSAPALASRPMTTGELTGLVVKLAG